MRVWAAATPVTVVCMIVALTGCGGVETGRTSATDVAQTDPSFQGPWASLFASAYQESTSEDERVALSDGKISDLEYAHFQQKILSCLKGIGVDASWGADGTLDYTRPNSVSNDDVQQCNKQGGLNVLLLHDAILRNPDNLNEDDIVTACLKRVHVVSGGYTPQDFAAGKDLDRISDTKEFAQCEAEPLSFGVRNK